MYFRGDDRTKSWSGGANLPSSGSNNFGVRAEQYTGTGAAGKFTIEVEADTTARIMRVYMASNDITTTITASLSDSSAGPATDNTTFSGSDAERHGYVDIIYQAGSAGQTLTVLVEVTVPKVTDDYGMVALQALAWRVAAIASDTNTPTDSAVSITQRLSVGVDTNTPTDSATSVTQRLSVAADTNTPTDSAVSGVISTCVAADTNTPTDSADAVTGFPAEAADTNTPTDSAVSITTRLSVGVDTNTPTDSAEGGVVNTCVAADTNTPTDSAEAGAQLPSVAADTNTPTDSAAATFVPAGTSAGVDTNTPSDSAVSITQRTAMGEDFNTPSDSAICIGPGGSVYQYIDGTAFDRYGRMMTVPIGASDPLPGSARYIMGIAHSANGRRYVTRWPGNVTRHIDGFALRADGVQIVAPDAQIDSALAGIPVTYRRETVVSSNNPVKAVGGFGLDSNGRLSVTNPGT